MNIWVDADACPAVIKDILFRAAERKRIMTTLVANQMLRVPPSQYVRAVQVPAGFDVADHHLAAQVQAGDLVITADIPLAAMVIERGGTALNPRGELYSAANIRESLSMRDFMEGLRSSGVQTGGPPPFSQADRQAFANQLDRLLARLA
ncbi:YaiI/YqxD family protein [Uliginosibacterium sp. H1]|uniref:YaiI/YqxD family protein n=1 Tax=Uliginosibacterium sp. H1 TaxID=3114757 RepID=UPI002E18809C|nr:YaiI/YqxD family protein [Uliginosibacterium sp. H1]